MNSFLKYELWIALIAFMIYFCMGGPEHWYCDYIYTYVLCNLKFTQLAATNLLSAFWASFTLGRATGIFISAKLKPRTIVFMNAITATTCFFIMYVTSLTGSDAIDTISWIISIVIPFAYSSTFAAGISWISEYISVTGFYAFFIGTGNFSGQAITPLGATLVETNAQLWFLSGGIYSSGVIIFSVVLLTLGTKLRSLHKNSNLE